jgi:hypothetical protein
MKQLLTKLTPPAGTENDPLPEGTDPNPGLAPTGEPNPGLTVVPSFSKSAINRYRKAVRRIDKNINAINNGLWELTEDLALIRDEQLYLIDGYTTMKEFAEKKYGKDPERIRQLIKAHDVMRELMEAGVSEEDLPENERLCRELRKVPLAGRPVVWKAVQEAAKLAGKKPDRGDVKRAAREKAGKDGDLETIEEAILDSLRKSKKALKVTIPFDALTDTFRAQLLGLAKAIADEATALMRSVTAKAVEERVAANGETDEEAEASE